MSPIATALLLRRGRVGNTLAEIAQFLGVLERQDDPASPSSMRVVLESTTNSRAMHRLMLAYGQQAGIHLRADVLDARKLRIATAADPSVAG